MLLEIVILKIMTISNLKEQFLSLYKKEAEHIFYSPGRINLIGEHIDYNGGWALPCAINLGIYGLFRVRADKKIRIYSLNFKGEGIIEFHLNEIKRELSKNFSDYPKGVFFILNQASYKLSFGLDILYYGSLPKEAGLSSSASIEVLTIFALSEIFSLKINPLEIVKLSQRVENEYIGVNSGVMDQFAVTFSKNNSAILLNCNTLEYKYLPLNLVNYSIIIMNTNKSRELSSSKYNKRREECERALLNLNKKLNIKFLCDLSEREYYKYKDLIEGVEERKRVEHVVLENIRTLKASELLRLGDLKEFGLLLNESHKSLKDLYEVSGEHLDTLVSEALKIKGVLGARMTGAGFGGCAIALVKNDYISKFTLDVGLKYKNAFGITADFYVAKSSAGVRKIF